MSSQKDNKSDRKRPRQNDNERDEKVVKTLQELRDFAVQSATEARMRADAASAASKKAKAASRKAHDAAEVATRAAHLLSRLQTAMDEFCANSKMEDLTISDILLACQEENIKLWSAHGSAVDDPLGGPDPMIVTESKCRDDPGAVMCAIIVVEQREPAWQQF